MESHNKTETSICLGKIGKEAVEEAEQYRILSVSLDGYMKVFDYAKFKIVHSIRFPNPLLSVGFSPDCSTRVIGTSNGIMYVGGRKWKAESEKLGDLLGGSKLQMMGKTKESQGLLILGYFHRGQNEKPSEEDHLIKRPKKVKVAEHDKLLKKLRHKEALVAVLSRKNLENIVAVVEELISY